MWSPSGMGIVAAICQPNSPRDCNAFVSGVPLLIRGTQLELVVLMNSTVLSKVILSGVQKDLVVLVTLR
jgi:hypothetical protein